MEAQNLTSSPSEDNKVMRPPSSSSTSSSSPSEGHPDNNGGIVQSFDCAICCESLMKPGPPLECFTFGKLLINLGQLPFLERDHIYREFQLYDQCFANGQFACDKIVSTVCGHIFHSGCIREWFFTQRMNMNPKCPFCKKATRYEECRVLHPVVCSYHDDEDTNDIGQNKEEEADNALANNFNEVEYSDISCTSSSWPSDNEGNDSDEENNGDADGLEEPFNLYHEEDGEYPNDEDDHADDQIDEGEEEAPDRVPPISYDDDDDDDDDDILYHPMYVVPREISNNSRRENSGQMSKMLGVFRKCNLVHVVTLLEVIKACCDIFHSRRDKFFHDMEETIDNLEDEKLTDIDYESLVPLGYHFILCFFLVGLIIWSGETLADLLFLKMGGGKSTKAMIKFTYLHGLLSLLAIPHYLVVGPTQRK